MAEVPIADSYMVVADDTPESRVALRYAALRARRLDVPLTVMMAVPRPGFMALGGVQEALEADAAEEAEERLAGIAAETERLTGVRPNTMVRVGDAAQGVLAAVRDDPRVRVLVLGAAARGAPGPLVEFFSGEGAGALPCLVMIVPGAMTEAMLARLA